MEMRVDLSDDSWYIQGQLPETLVQYASENFDNLWNLRPPDRTKSLIFGKEVLAPRFSTNYLTPYKYDDILHDGDPIPDLFSVFHEWAGGLEKYNQCVVNWYDGSLNHHIALHSDSEKDLETCHEIMSISVGHERVFRIRNEYNKWDIAMNHGSYIIMGGKFQYEFRHEVPKMTLKELKRPPHDKRRINITMRRMKTC